MSKLIPDIFEDVFGPVMQPGSSSHTAGPCKIGNEARKLVKGKLKKIQIQLDANGSFAGTFGHMNEDIGMLAGAYGLKCDDERLFEIKEILKSEGIDYEFEYVTLENKHPNAVRFILTDEDDKKYSLEGNSIGGGRIEIVSINDKAFTKKNEEEKIQLFDSFNTWINESERANENLYETALRYEVLLSKNSKKKVLDTMRERRRLMELETEAPHVNPVGIIETPYSGYHFRKWDKYIEEGRSIQSGINTRILKYVFNVQALTKGVKLVPGPMGTGGGFLYSTIRAFEEDKHIDEDKIVESLFVAAGVGIIAYSKSDPTGEITGCAGECGVCQAMTAAAITYLEGGTAKEIENAASLALQSSLGWACDPIPGGDNQPCLSRFVTSSIMAITFADLALSGRSAVIPFDEAVEVMDRMGREMPEKYKCTSEGGICEAPCALACKKRFTEWFNNKDRR
jgi:L-serine dehydratase